MSDIKDVLPIDNINPGPAVDTLSKKESGSLIIMFIIIMMVLLAFIIFLALNSNPQCSEEKRMLREDIEKLQIRISSLEGIEDLIKNENKLLTDSLTRYKLFEQFNATAGPKQIILEPKKEKK